ncbi:hypothetical protein QBC36DRAFT_174585, partial [Triangularia setosa]
KPHGVDQSQQRSTYLCSFPRFPVHRSGESVQASYHHHHQQQQQQQHRRQDSLSPPSRYSLTPRTLPPFPGSNDYLHPYLGPKKPALPSRPLPARAPHHHHPLEHDNNNNYFQDDRSPTDTSFRRRPQSVSPPPLSHRPSQKPRTVFTSASKARPLRLVQQSRRRRPTVFYAQHSHSFLQSLTCITINQDTSFLSSYQEQTNDKMASNPVMPKVAPPFPSAPSNTQYGAGGQQQHQFSSSSSNNNTQEKLLADLRRQLDDSASDASSVDSRGRRRRRNNKQLAQAGGLSNPAVLPRLADTKPVRLQLGLNLDVEVELKARLQGDVSLTLLVEEKPTARPQDSTELIPDLFGVVYGYKRKEMFYMRIGQMSFRQKWVEREVSSSLTLAVCLLILVLGMVIGFVVGKWVDLVVFGVGASSSAVAATAPGCVGFGVNLSSASSSGWHGSSGIVIRPVATEDVPVVMGWEYHHGRNSGTEYCGSWLLG